MLEVARTIGQYINCYTLVVNKSKVPVGTAEKVKSVVQKELTISRKVFDFDVCSNPEFLKEGFALEDFTKGSRIVVGNAVQTVSRLAAWAYAAFSLFDFIPKNDKLSVSELKRVC